MTLLFSHQIFVINKILIMNTVTYGIYFAISLSIISISLIAFNPLGSGNNLIILIISLELF